MNAVDLTLSLFLAGGDRAGAAVLAHHLSVVRQFAIGAPTQWFVTGESDADAAEEDGDDEIDDEASFYAGQLACAGTNGRGYVYREVFAVPIGAFRLDDLGDQQCKSLFRFALHVDFVER